MLHKVNPVRRGVRPFALLVLVIIGLFLIAPAFASVQQQENVMFTVLAGFDDPAQDGLAMEAFLPQDISNMIQLQI